VSSNLDISADPSKVFINTAIKCGIENTKIPAIAAPIPIRYLQ
jgi:hypothetical protein